MNMTLLRKMSRSVPTRELKLSFERQGEHPIGLIVAVHLDTTKIVAFDKAWLESRRLLAVPRKRSPVIKNKHQGQDALNKEQE
jgi:hypothetical protein